MKKYVVLIFFCLILFVSPVYAEPLGLGFRIPSSYEIFNTLFHVIALYILPAYLAVALIIRFILSKLKKTESSQQLTVLAAFIPTGIVYILAIIYVALLFSKIELFTLQFLIYAGVFIFITSAFSLITYLIMTVSMKILYGSNSQKLLTFIVIAILFILGYMFYPKEKQRYEENQIEQITSLIECSCGGYATENLCFGFLKQCTEKKIHYDPYIETIL